MKRRYHAPPMLVTPSNQSHRRQARLPRLLRWGADLAFAAAYAALALRLFLLLMPVGRSGVLTAMLAATTHPLVSPFQLLLPESVAPGDHTLVLAVFLAIGVHGMAHLGIRQLLRPLLRRRLYGTTTSLFQEVGRP